MVLRAARSSLAMQEERFLQLTKYIFKAPDWKTLVLFSLLLSLLFGMFFDFHHGILTPIGALVAGFVLIGLPAVSASFFTLPLVRLYARSSAITLNRSALLSFLNTIIIGIFVILSYFVSMMTQRWDVLSGYSLALGFVFGFRLLILLATVNNNVLKIAFPASLQTLFGAFLLLLYLNHELNLVSFYMNLAIFCVIFAVGSFLYIKYMDAPMKKTLGVSGMDLLRTFIAHLSEGSTEMEEIFKKIGEPVDIPITVIAFRNEKKLKTVFVVPSAHTGLTGKIGGGDLPSHLTNCFDSFVLVPHGLANHDFDLISKEETRKVEHAAREALSSIKFQAFSTPSIRFVEGDVKMRGQRFGDSVMLVFTTAPKPSEDAEFALGITAMAEARAEGARDTAIIDAHSCGMIGTKGITLGSKLSFDILKCVKKTTAELFKAKEGRIKVGIAHKSGFPEDVSIGELGIRVVVTELFNRRNAYILIDGNNMVKGLRERIINSLNVEGIEAEVMTTDTHAMNKKEVYNYVGMKTKKHDEIINTIKEAVKEAISDLEPVEVGAGTGIAKNVFVFGSHTTAKLLSTANATVVMGGFLAVSVTVATIALSILAFLLV